MSRKSTAADRLAALRACSPERPELIPQHLDDWLQVATGAEVRRHWRRYWGRLPGWAVAS